MGAHLSTYLACASLALAHFFTLGAGTARAQETDGQVLLGVGFAPLSINYGQMEIEDYSRTTRTAWQVGPGGDALLAAGYGIGAWVFALEAAITYAVSDEEQTIQSPYDWGAQELTTKRTDIMLGPSVRFLFMEGGVRPFVELGGGAGIGLHHAENDEESDTTLYVRGGPGLQIRLADDVSIDVMLRAGYAATFGEIKFPTNAIGQSLDGTITYAQSTFDYTVQQVSADLTARLSIWL